MSRVLINRYLAKIDELRAISGRTNEQIIRPAFRRLAAYRIRVGGALAGEAARYGNRSDRPRRRAAR